MTIEISDPAARGACEELLSIIGVSDKDMGGTISIAGADPVVPSRLRYGAATTSALAAQGAAIAAIWKERSGEGQDVAVDLPRAVNLGLRTVQNLTQNGRSFTVGSLTRASNFFRTRDGRQIYLLRNTGRGSITTDLVGFLRCANTTDALAQAVSQWDASELEEALAERKLPGVVARIPLEWLNHPQGQWLAARPGVEIEKIGDSPREPFAPLDGVSAPLSGVRVLDASHVIAGPATGRLLAEQGADVLHVTTPSEQEHVHVMMDTGLGKRAAYIDLNQVRDVEQLRELARHADIFIQSWRPGAMARRGFSPMDVAAIRPGIIYVSLSCYGDEGVWSERGGYEPIGQVVSGLSATEGTIDAPRNAPTVTMNDYLTAYLAGAGTLGALLRRARDGGSYHVKASLTQSSMWVLGRGTLDEAPAAESIKAYIPREGEILSMGSPFGDLRYVAPITQYSRTRGRWTSAPQPAGSGQAQWI